MSASRSFLSDSKYRYDFVVATTQASINATLKQFLLGLKGPVTTVCFAYDDSDNLVPVEHAVLVKAAHGSDPFKIPADADPASPDLQNLLNAGFGAGFRAQLGLPPGYPDPTEIPDLVSLGDEPSSVTFNLLCSQFDIVELASPRPNRLKWSCFSQPLGQAWIFQAKVDLRLSATEPSAYSQLPPAVQARIKNLGGTAFSVQQVLFDLTNASLTTQRPRIQGVEPGTKLEELLQRFFLSAYFAEMQKDGQPLLGAAIKAGDASSRSSLVLTDLDININPFLDDARQPIAHPNPSQQGLATLNFLCAANGRPLPPRARFDWNWLDPNERGTCHGVAVVNKTAFVDYFKNVLIDYVRLNCWNVQPQVVLKGVGVYYDAIRTNMHDPKITVFADDSPRVLSFSYESGLLKDGAGAGDSLGEMSARYSFTLDVSFQKNTITIEQQMTLWTQVWAGLVHSEGDIIRQRGVDTYTLAVDQEGELAPNGEWVLTDASEEISVNGFANFFGGGINAIIKKLEVWSKGLCRSCGHIDLPRTRAFIFPGGQSFTFSSEASFSDHGDLVALISYVDPS